MHHQKPAVARASSGATYMLATKYEAPVTPMSASFTTIRLSSAVADSPRSTYGYGKKPVVAFTSDLGPSPLWLPLRPAEYGSEHPTPSRDPFGYAVHGPHTVPCSAVKPCLSHDWPSCSNLPSRMR